jgi:hypothetical protein
MFLKLRCVGETNCRFSMCPDVCLSFDLHETKIAQWTYAFEYGKHGEGRFR